MSDFLDRKDPGIESNLSPNQTGKKTNWIFDLPQDIFELQGDPNDADDNPPFVSLRDPWNFGTVRRHTFFDISAANKTSEALPSAADSTGQVHRFTWNSGDSTYTFEIDTSENLIFPDTTTRTPTQAAGEGSGFIEIESDGTNWNVLSYKDTIEISDANPNLDRTIIKNIDGTGVATGIHNPGTFNITTAWGGIYRYSGTYTVNIGYTSTLSVKGVAVTVRNAAIGALVFTPTVAGFSYRPWNGSAVSNRTEDFDYQCRLTWY
jgi:hypothetical protein